LFKSRANGKERLYIDARAIASEKISGIGHNLVEIIRALERMITNGEELDIILLVPISKTRFIEQWGFEQVRIKTMPIPMRVINVLERFRLLPPMDVFLGQGSYLFPNYTNWPLLMSKSFTYIHDIGFVLYPQFVEPRNLRLLLKSVPRWIKRSDKIIAISHNASQEISEHYNLPKRQVQVVPCGVDIKLFKPQSQKSTDQLKKTYNLPTEYLLYFGNIEPRKNLVSLIGAYKSLPNKLKEKYALVLAGGDGWLNEPIHEAIQQAKKEGNNIIMPSQYVSDKDLPALYSGAAVLVHPSYYEGFGISPLQAMACGVPVITSGVSAMPEVVGDAGLYINPDDQKDISDKISLLMNNTVLRDGLIKKGLSRARQFGWDGSAVKLLAIIRNTE
jgi:glycosyltransferase involved in cell wall biosynthesis